MSYFGKLARQLLYGPLEEEDIPSVKDLIMSLEAKFNSLGAINDLINKQIELEAGTVYLLYKYTVKLEEATIRYEDEKARIFIGTPDRMFDRKVTRELRESLSTTDESLKQLLEDKTKLDVFCRALQQLQRLVFARDRKLEVISTNYRREIHADENAG